MLVLQRRVARLEKLGCLSYCQRAHGQGCIAWGCAVHSNLVTSLLCIPASLFSANVLKDLTIDFGYLLKQRRQYKMTPIATVFSCNLFLPDITLSYQKSRFSLIYNVHVTFVPDNSTKFECKKKKEKKKNHVPIYTFPCESIYYTGNTNAQPHE